MAGKKTTVDWPSVKADWLKSDMSIRRLAEWYQISEALIRKRANQEGWGERAHGKPANGARQKVRTDPKPEPVMIAGVDATDPEQVVGRGHNLIFRMLDELEATTTHAGQLAEMIEVHIEDPRSKAAMMKAVELKGRAEVVKTLALAFKTWNEARAVAPEGKKAQRQAAAEAVAAPGNKFAARSGPRLAVSNP